MPEPASFDRSHLEDLIRDARLRYQKAEDQIDVIDKQIKELEVRILGNCFHQLGSHHPLGGSRFRMKDVSFCFEKKLCFKNQNKELFIRDQYCHGAT